MTTPFIVVVSVTGVKRALDYLRAADGSVARFESHGLAARAAVASGRDVYAYEVIYSPHHA